MVAGLLIVPFEQYINGGRIPLGGVSSVASLPEHRRGGYVGGLLSYALRTMRDAGQALSALYTPHNALYRRFGWEIASRVITHSFAPKEVRLQLPPPGGSYRRVTPDGWRELDGIYTQYVSVRNGAMVRSEKVWRVGVFSLDRPADAVTWHDGAGTPRGYAVYRVDQRPGAPGSARDEPVLRANDWAALDPEAYSAVLGFLMRHDNVNRIRLPASPDEPVGQAFEEPHAVEQRAWNGIMLRIVDVPRALELRPALPQGSGLGVTVSLTDGHCPWNAGTWRIECREGRIAAEPASSAPELEMDVRALAPIFNGHVRPADAARVGSVRARSQAALDAAAAIFATPYAPHCPDEF